MPSGCALKSTDDDEHLSTPYEVAGTVLSTLHRLTHLTLVRICKAKTVVIPVTGEGTGTEK